MKLGRILTVTYEYNRFIVSVFCQFGRDFYLKHHGLNVRAFFVLILFTLSVFLAPAYAQYIYVEPSTYLVLDSIWTGRVRTASAEIGCQLVADAYTQRAGSPYSGRVWKLTHPTPIYWGCYLDRRYADGPWNHNLDLEGYIHLTPECPANYVFDTLVNNDGSTHLRCRGVASPNLVLSLSVPIETRPTGTGSQATVDLTAKVTQSENPKAGVDVSFSVEVIPYSGGHEHDSAARPKGTLSQIQGVTKANGELVVAFTAPEFSGIHTIKATCPSCSNKKVSKEIQVKVPDLLPISPNPPKDAGGAFMYALTSVDKTHQGNGRYHVNQYYLTEQSRQNLRSMIAAFSAEGWGTVGLNDASLYWGGRYDIESTWGGSHKGHREGREIDISFSRAGNLISKSKQNVFYKKFCEDKAVQIPFSILHHYVANRHFHVYLERQRSCWKSEE